MLDDEALTKLKTLAENGRLVWVSFLPPHLGGGFTVQVIGDGPDRIGHGETLGLAVENVLAREAVMQ